MITYANADTSSEALGTTSNTALVCPERQRRTAKEKSEYLALFSESGLTAADFCREMGLSEATFSLWRRHQQLHQQLQQQMQDTPEIARVVISGDDNFDELIETSERLPGNSPAASVYIRLPNGIETKVFGLGAAAISKLLRSLAR